MILRHSYIRKDG